jgi:hypothetical protein
MTTAVAQNLADAVKVNWTADMAPECPAPTTLQQVEVTDLSSPAAGQAFSAGPVFGTRGDDSIPSNACVLIHYPVGTRYRGGHPRQYLYVLGNADLLGAAEWSVLAQAEVLAHWTNFLNTIVGTTSGGTAVSGICAVSYISKEVNPVPPYRRPVPMVLDIDTGLASAESEMASQRRRIGRVKR